MRECYLVSSSGWACPVDGSRQWCLPVYRACRPLPCSRCDETIADADLFTRPEGEPVCSECLPCMYEWIDADGNRAAEWSQGWTAPTEAGADAVQPDATPAEITK